MNTCSCVVLMHSGEQCVIWRVFLKRGQGGGVSSTGCLVYSEVMQRDLLPSFSVRIERVLPCYCVDRDVRIRSCTAKKILLGQNFKYENTLFQGYARG